MKDSGWKALRDQIYEEKTEYHRLEAKYYDVMHFRMHNQLEQKRLAATLNRLVALVGGQGRKALDFDSGAGNIMGKLLHMDYEVTAVDISQEMCNVLRRKHGSFVATNMICCKLASRGNAF